MWLDYAEVPHRNGELDRIAMLIDETSFRSTMDNAEAVQDGGVPGVGPRAVLLLLVEETLINDVLQALMRVVLGVFFAFLHTGGSYAREDDGAPSCGPVFALQGYVKDILPERKSDLAEAKDRCDTTMSET